MDDILRYNPAGVYLSASGKIFTAADKTKKEIFPEKDINGYLFIDDKNLPGLSFPSGDIQKQNNQKAKGKYLHRMIVFTFGDCYGRKYNDCKSRAIIDHIDMNKENCSVSNLQLVSTNINLFRAYYKSKDINCEKRFKDYFNSLDDIDKKIAEIEIKLDLEGIY